MSEKIFEIENLEQSEVRVTFLNAGSEPQQLPRWTK